MRKLATILVLSALASTGLLAAAADPASAGPTPITVDSAADDGTGGCTLREAIVSANSGTNEPGCAGATGGFDTINFNLVAPATITLGSALPPIAAPGGVIINGPGQENLTIDGNGFRILESVPPLGINNLTLRDGDAPAAGAGGAILQNGALNVLQVNGVTFLDNQADSGGAISAANASVLNSTFRGNDATGATGTGGAISTGVLTLTDSTLGGPNGADANTAVLGGGAVSAGNATASSISGSTFQGNTTGASGQGAAVRLDGNGTITGSTFATNVAGAEGGGLLAINGTINVERSAFFGSGGTSGSAIHTFNSTLNVEHSTFSANGASAISANYFNPLDATTLRHITIDNPAGTAVEKAGPQGTVTLTRSIVSNTGVANGCTGSIVDGGYNLIDTSSPGSCPTFGTNIVGDSFLGPLGIGVPGTPPAHHPESGSLAVDAIPFGDCIEPNDQRSVARPFPSLGSCDIGAVEVDLRPDGLIAKTGQPLLGGNAYNATGSGQSVTQSKGKKKVATYDLEVENDAPVSTDAIIARGPGGNKKFGVKYFNLNGDDVTSQVTAPGGYNFSNLAPGDDGTLTLEVKIKAKAKKGNQRQTLVTFASDNFEGRVDAVLAITRRR